MRLTAAALARNVALAVAYTGVFAYAYVGFLHRYYEYAGYALHARDAGFLALTFAIAVLPVVFYRGLREVSSAISVFVYLVLYVPIVVTFALGSQMPVDDVILVQLTFMFGMSLLFLADAARLANPLAMDSGLNLMPIVLILTVGGTAYTLVVYSGSLAFASFDDVYLQRFATQSLGSGLVTRYLTSWLSTVLVPLCFAYGLVSRTRRYFVAATVACVVLYMAAANKFVLLLPFAYLGFYLTAGKRLASLYPLLATTLGLLIAFLVATASPNSLLFLGSSVLLNRTIGNGGQLTLAYYDFFSVHPQTNYSHVTGIRLFTHPYPYGDLGVGQVIGEFYWSPFMNANANFWATDGIAAMGLTGVAVASVGCALLFVLIDTMTRRYDTLFAVLCFLPFVIVLLNQSMFSAFWSGGAFMLLLFFLFNKPSGLPLRETGHGALTERP